MFINPAHGAWHKLTHQETELITDLPVTEAQEIFRQIVWFDEVLDAFVPKADVATPPLRMILFSKRRAFAQIANNKHFAAYTQPEISRTSLIVGPSPDGDLLQHTLHEYVHYRVRTQPISYPLWYEEGLATILATTQFSVDDASVSATTDFAIPEKFKASSLPRIPLQRLVQTTSLEDWPHKKINGFYKHSAALTRMLLNSRAVANPHLGQRLNTHLANREADLFETLQMAPSAVHNLTRRYTALRSKPSHVTHPSAKAITPSHIQLTDSEVDLLLAQAATMTNPRRAERLYRKLIKMAPDDAALWAQLAGVLRYGKTKQADSALDTAITLDPAHPDVLMQKALARLTKCPLDRTLDCLEDWQHATLLLRDVLAINPNHFTAIMWLGVTELYSGNPGGAVNYLNIVYKRAPWSPRVNYLLGESLRLLGNPRALPYLRNAQQWAFDPDIRKWATAAIKLHLEQG